MKTPIVLGIDANSHKIAVVWKNRQGRPLFRTYKLAENNYSIASGMAQRAIWEFLDEGINDELFIAEDLRVFLEAPVLGKGGPGATIPQAYVEGAIMGAFWEFEVPVKLVNNKVWKKRILENGNIDKAEVTRRMSEVWPEFLEQVPIVHPIQYPGGKNDQPDQDIVDAGAVHLFGEWNISFVDRVKRQRLRGVEV